MKKAKKTTAKVSRKRPAARRKTKPTRTRTTRRPTRAARRQAASGPKSARTKASETRGNRVHARSAARLAASVLSRRAAKAETLAKVATTAKPQPKMEPRVARSGPAKATKPAAMHSRRSHGAASVPGNRAVVRVSRAPQFNYMKAPGIDSGFDVGDTVEVFCDHEKDGERTRGWVKGVVVQVDNKLVAVQFRSNVFLTDGWMVPDRILWYSLGSDQIRNAGAAKKAPRTAIPEY